MLATSPVATGEAKQEEPRKGTEMTPAAPLPQSTPHFKTISPQGDGNITHLVDGEIVHVFQNHIPARGRKQCPTPTVGTSEHPYFKTISPQGDGNSSAIVKSSTSRLLISKPYPRKGTERTSSLPCRGGGGGTRSVPEGAPWTQAVNLHSIRSARKAQAPPSARMLATSPVATGEAKQEEPRKGTEPTHRANRPNKKSSHISGCSFRIVLINVLFLFPRISSKKIA